MNNSLMRDLADKERMAVLGQSSAELVHDLRNPLMIVTGYVDLLSRELEKTRSVAGADYAHTSDYLDIIEKNVKRCNDLAHMWQKFGKSDMTALTTTSMSDILDDLMDGLELLAFAESVEIVRDEESLGIAINGNHAQILRAIHNLVANAIHAVVPGSGKIRIGCRSVDAHAEIVVQDNGVGMTPEVQSRIFEPYFTTKSQGKGTGLGLAITKKIVEEHCGAIRIDSTPGVGTSIIITLPLAKVEADAASTVMA